MDNNEKYRLIAEEGISLPSSMGVLSRTEGFSFSVEQIERALKTTDYFDVASFNVVENENAEALFSFEAELVFNETSYECWFSVYPTEIIDLPEFGFANQVSKAEMDLAFKQTEYLKCSTYFSDSPTESYLFQLKVLHAIVPNAAIVLDFMPWRILSGEWLQMTAPSNTPPSPGYLYTVHAVYNEEKDGTRAFWLHTHGLHRCGCVELEMINVRNGVEELHGFLHLVAKMFIDEQPAENEEFTVGYDGLGIKLCWRRWEDVVVTLPADVTGGLNDRKDKTDIHCEPTGVLLGSQENEVCSPEIYVKTLQEDPLLFISNEETQRMSDMAKERFDYFTDALKNHLGDEGWGFLVKLGYGVDDAQSENDKEHLWFEVNGFEDGMLMAELLNDPYWISRMKKGEIGVHSPEQLTDWMIYSPIAPGNSFTPDSIYQLRQLESE